jgi:hypothetical protein
MTERDLEEIEAIGDPAARAKRAGELLNAYQGYVNQLASIRRDAIAELRASGLSYAQVGEVLGVSRGRIAQLRGPAPDIEQEFFGGKVVAITTPLRTSGLQRPVIAHEDFAAATSLARFLETFDIETTMHQVAPTGEIDFSPSALVAICGPKSSTVIRDLIAADPIYDFSPDERGQWRILERRSGNAFSSPIDETEDDADFAYVARLNRPDGRPLLVIAGIHAIGSLGAVHFLTRTANLHQLHHRVGTQPFSMVISSAFKRSPLQITSSAYAAEPLLHADARNEQRPTNRA